LTIVFGTPLADGHCMISDENALPLLPVPTTLPLYGVPSGRAFMSAGRHRNDRFPFRFPMAATIRIRSCPSPTTRVILQAAECHRGGLETLSPSIALVGWRLRGAARGRWARSRFTATAAAAVSRHDFLHNQHRRTQGCRLGGIAGRILIVRRWRRKLALGIRLGEPTSVFRQ
jgi:hypothetical protein